MGFIVTQVPYFSPAEKGQTFMDLYHFKMVKYYISKRALSLPEMKEILRILLLSFFFGGFSYF